MGRLAGGVGDVSVHTTGHTGRGRLWWARAQRVWP